jgi:hypothetical protein
LILIATSCGNGVQCTSQEPTKDTKEHKTIWIEIQIDCSNQHRTFTIITSKRIALARQSEVTFSSARTYTVFSLTLEIKITYSSKEDALHFKITIALPNQEQKKSLPTI